VIRFCAIVLFLSWVLASSAIAQDTLADIFTVDPEKAETYADVGAAVVTRETYVGSGKSSVFALPYANASYKGRWFLNPALGAGTHIIHKKNVRLSTSAHVALGRKAEDTPYNFAPFEIDTTFTAKVAGRYLLPIAALDVVGTIPIGGDLEGSKVDALLTTQFTVFEGFKLAPGVRATYMSTGWLDSYYGINADQALAAGLVQTSFVDAGFSTLGAHAAGIYKLSENYELIGIVNYSQLIGDVKSSPLAPSDNGVTAAFAVSRKF